MRTRLLFLPLAAVVFAACHKSDERDSNIIGTPLPAANAPLAPGEVRIASTDGAFTLGVARDTVYLRFSDSVQTKLAHDLDTNKTESSGIGASIEKMVKRNVGKLLSRQITYPVADIKSATYQDGAIKFQYRDKHALSFEDIKANKRPVLETFAPADAQRLVAAVNAAKGAR